MHESRAAGHWRPACTDRTVAVVPPTTATPLREGQPPQLSDDETWLTQRAAEGDSAAFARLYDRYERRAYNLCYRITGSRDDAADATQETFLRVLERLPRLMGRELQFGPYLLRAARHASYDAIARRRRAAPSAEIPDSAVPVGSGEPEPDRPERQVLLEAHQEQIRAANATLPTRQREALALRELEELSYDEIAEIMGMNRNSVAQLLSRARIGLRDGLRRSALGSIASASPDCERALPLLALRQDGALDRDAAWLTQHLSDCSICPARVAAMEEAGGVYRLWLPLVPAVWLRGEIANAAEHIGAASSRLPMPSRRARRLAAGCSAVVLVLLPAALVPADAAEAPATPPPAAAQVRGWSTAAPTPTPVTVRATATADPVRTEPVSHSHETKAASPRHVKRPPARLHGTPPAGELHAAAPVRRPPPRVRPKRHDAARLADVPASPLPVDDAPGEVEPCGDPAPFPARPGRAPCSDRPCDDAAPAPARPPCSERPCAPGGSAPVPPRCRPCAPGGSAPICRPCRPGGPPRPPGACPARPCLPPSPAPAGPPGPRPLGPDRLRDGGDAAPGSPAVGRARPSP